MTKKKKIIGISLFIIGIGVIAAGIFLWNNFKGIKPAVAPAPKDISEEIKKGQNNTDFPLNVAENFKVSVFAENLPEARVIVKDGLGNYWVSQTDKGQISLLEVQDGEVRNKSVIFRHLNRPHGLALDPESPTVLYIAETDRISKVHLYSEGRPEKIADLPEGGRHYTRTIGFGDDGRLYVSIGSSCDTCVEADERRAAIYSMNKDGSDMRRHAYGLRNAVFFEWHSVTGEMWATEMGRDNLGDDLPPDEINIVKKDGFYGWPYYYGNNTPDTQFRSNSFFENFDPPSSPVGSHINLQAHVAPLGLDFIPATESWPEGMHNDLIVAYHGSWNRSVPVGYKIARIELTEEGALESPVEEETGFVQENNFISGWLTENNNSMGRPVDVLVEPEGMMYITDDKAGLVYKVEYIGEK